MPKYGPSGRCLKAIPQKKSLKARRRTTRQIGLAPVVKRGWKNADEIEMPEAAIEPMGRQPVRSFY